MNSLDRKLFRDLWHARGQVIAIANTLNIQTYSLLSFTLLVKTHYYSQARSRSLMHNLGISRYLMLIDGVHGVVVVSNRYFPTEVIANFSVS